MKKNVSPVVAIVVVVVLVVVAIVWALKATAPKSSGPPRPTGGEQVNPNARMPGGMRGGPGSKMFQRSPQGGGPAGASQAPGR